MLFHHTARGIDGCPVFSTWEEARALWDTVLRVAPQPRALFLMGNHLHLLHDYDLRAALGDALSGYTRHRNAILGQRGSLFDAVRVEPVSDEKKHRRVERYVHLQGCRARIHACPLEWPFSTHRDATGLTVWPVRPRATDPERYHRYVSSDPTCRVQGTDWPVRQLDTPDPKAILHATSSVTRTPLSALRSRGPARALFVRAARWLTTASAAEIGDLCGLTRQAVSAIPARRTAEVALVESVWADPRFCALSILPRTLHARIHPPSNRTPWAETRAPWDSPNDETPTFDA